MPTPDCPEAREYVGPTWPATLAPPFDLPAHYPTPAAFAPRVAWACVAVHYDYPDTMVKDAEEAADPDTWRTRTAALGAYEYPAEVFAQQPGVEFGVGGVTGARGNPWTFLAAMRVMGDDTLGGTITDVYRLTGTTSLPGFPAGAFILQQGDATAVDGTSPAQYAAVFGPPESQGRHFDAATGTWTAIPGGTGGDLGTHLLRFGNEHPFEASSWTGYLAYNVPPLGVPGDPLCGPEVEPADAAEALALAQGPCAADRRPAARPGAAGDDLAVVAAGVPAAAPAVRLRRRPVPRASRRAARGRHARRGGDALQPHGRRPDLCGDAAGAAPTDGRAVGAAHHRGGRAARLHHACTARPTRCPPTCRRGGTACCSWRPSCWTAAR
jgi:hypothetical protein